MPVYQCDSTASSAGNPASGTIEINADIPANASCVLTGMGQSAYAYQIVITDANGTLVNGTTAGGTGSTVLSGFGDSSLTFNASNPMYFTVTQGSNNSPVGDNSLYIASYTPLVSGGTTFGGAWVMTLDGDVEDGDADFNDLTVSILWTACSG